MDFESRTTEQSTTAAPMQSTRTPGRRSTATSWRRCPASQVVRQHASSRRSAAPAPTPRMPLASGNGGHNLGHTGSVSLVEGLAGQAVMQIELTEGDSEASQSQRKLGAPRHASQATDEAHASSSCEWKPAHQGCPVRGDDPSMSPTRRAKALKPLAGRGNREEAPAVPVRIDRRVDHGHHRDGSCARRLEPTFGGRAFGDFERTGQRDRSIPAPPHPDTRRVRGLALSVRVELDTPRA
jgi:hypothetical protein